MSCHVASSFRSRSRRERLALHFSKNCLDWCFAGLVADSGSPGQGRHYASLVIDGDARAVPPFGHRQDYPVGVILGGVLDHATCPST